MHPRLVQNWPCIMSKSDYLPLVDGKIEGFLPNIHINIYIYIHIYIYTHIYIYNYIYMYILFSIILPSCKRRLRRFCSRPNLQELSPPSHLVEILPADDPKALACGAVISCQVEWPSDIWPYFWPYLVGIFPEI